MFSKKEIRKSYYDILAGILIIYGIFLRFYFLNRICLSTDEQILISYAQGILKRGYPSKHLGRVLNPLCTYELSAYILAFFQIIGFKGIWVRVSALLASTGVLAGIWKFGKQLFNEKIAFLALSFYALSPIAIHFGSYVFHVQYDQFFYFLAGIMIMFYLNNENKKIKGWVLGIILSLLYLCWEGSIFILPIFIGLILWRKKLEVIITRTFWEIVLIPSIVIFLQLCWRTINSYPHLLHGMTPFFFTPTLAFLNPQFDPWFLIRHCFFSYGYVVLVILGIIGVLNSLNRDSTQEKIPFLLFLLPALCIHLFLLHPLSHYFYFLFPFLCIAAAIGVEKISQKFKLSFWLWGTIMLILSPMWPLKIYLGFFPQELFYHRRPEFIWVEYKRIYKYLKRHVDKDIIIVHTASHILPKDVKIKKIYFLQLTSLVTTFYDPIGKEPFYHDKFEGKSSIKSVRKLEDILSKEKKVCIFIFNEDRFEDFARIKLKNFIKSYFYPVCEDGNAILYCNFRDIKLCR